MSMTTNIIGAYSEEQTANLTGLSVHRLRYWDRTGFFVPSFAAENRRVPFSRVYSFEDLVSLQVLRALTIEARCSVQHLREVKEKLAQLGEHGWAHTTLYVLNRKVVFENDETGELHEPVSGQLVLQIPLRLVRRNMRAAVQELNKRDDADFGRIVRKRNINHNAAVIAGTRIPVAAIKRLSEDGYVADRIIQQYPSLTKEDIEAALRYKEKDAA
jgi:uncharacterized protein (DUF433 family)